MMPVPNIQYIYIYFSIYMNIYYISVFSGVYLVPRSLPSPYVCDSGCILSDHPGLLYHHLSRLEKVKKTPSAIDPVPVPY